MKQPITNYLTLIERRNNPIEKFYSRYVLRYFIDTDVFTAVIKNLVDILIIFLLVKLAMLLFLYHLLWLFLQ